MAEEETGLNLRESESGSSGSVSANVEIEGDTYKRAHFFPQGEEPPLSSYLQVVASLQTHEEA